MTFDDIVAYYKANVPQGPEQPGTDAWNNRFNSWTSQVERLLNIPGGDFNDPSSGWSNINPSQLDEFEATGGGSPGSTVPLEQGLLQTALPGIMGNIGADTGRQDIANSLQQNAITDYNATRGLIGQAMGGGQFDWQQYIKNDPGMIGALNDLITQGYATDLSSAAQYHYDHWGKAEGRTPYYTTDQRLTQENAQADATAAALANSARTAATSQLGALQTSIGQLQGNLQGELAQRAAALQQQIAAFNQNLDQYDATQRQALAQQIADSQQNLETSIASQRQALTQEADSLRTATDAQSVARKAALADEIAGLTAAQEPMAKARMQSAEALTTAINLGLEATKDQLTADQAQAGYLGGSTMSDSALARAVISARQQGAQAIGSAREANAGDTRTIQNRAATEGRSLSDELANNRLGIASNEATGNFDLSKQLATGTRGISDFGAAGRAGISNSTGAGRMNIGNTGASTTYNDDVYGAGAGKSIADALAQGTYGINTNLSTQLQGATDKGTVAKQNYFDNDYTRQLSLAGQLPGLTNSLASTTTNLAGVGNSGLKDSLGLLQWWSSGATPAPLATSNPTPDTSGTGIGNLGAGLTGAALNVGAANRWWQTPTATTTPTLATNLGGNLAICWVARVAFNGEPKWMAFRGWMLSKAPLALREFYIANGEHLAEELRALPEMQAEFRSVMDRILETA